jgi:predicted RNA-binding Zn ribbon-like protein
MENIKTKTIINFIVSKPNKKNTIRIEITGSDIDLTKDDDLQFLKVLTNEYCTMLFVHVHKIPRSNFKREIKKTT